MASMKQTQRTISDGIRVVFALIFSVFALFLIAGAAFVCHQPERAPTVLSDDAPENTIGAFFDALKDQDWKAASECVSDGSSFSLDTELSNAYSSRFWQAQRESWAFEPTGAFEADGRYLTRTVKVSALQYYGAEAFIREYVQSRLTAKAEAAELESEVYDDHGDYREDLVLGYLDEAIDEYLRDPSEEAAVSAVTVKLSYGSGGWKIDPDKSLVEALTGGWVSSVSPADLETAYDTRVNHCISAALSNLLVIPVVLPEETVEAAPEYILPEDMVVAPAPDRSLFGSTKTAADTAQVLEQAPLLAGRQMVWTPGTKTVKGTQIRWYSDETIFAITWRQTIDEMRFTFAEIVIAHPSQFRRYLADNSFSSTRRYTPSSMAKKVHAVMAFSGDFFKYRNQGIVVYRRDLYRSDGKTLDTCFIDSEGDLHLVKKKTLSGKSAITDYIRDNDILFTLSFGPIMIQDGKVVVPDKYPVGRINDSFSRCVICQIDRCHYLMATATVAHSKNLTLKRVAKALQSMGIQNAYALDGGQTATFIMNNKLVNTVDFGSERPMSDIIYFASAIPEGE